jgi:hypothetical protein
MLKGSTLTFGTTIYHGNAPLNRYNTFDLTADRFDTSGVHTLDQARNSNYQAFFVENIFRFGKFHVVPSLRGALKAVAAGIDGLVVEGNEGGGFKAPTGASTCRTSASCCRRRRPPTDPSRD